MKLDPSLAIDKQIKLYDSSTIVVKMANLLKVNVPSELNDILIVVDQKNQQK